MEGVTTGMNEAYRLHEGRMGMFLENWLLRFGQHKECVYCT